MTTIEPSLKRDMPPNRTCDLPVMSCGRPARSALKRSKERSSSGSTLYFVASIRKSRCSSASFAGLLLREILRLGPILVRVVELPDIVVEGALVRTKPGDAVPRDRRPSLVVDAAVAEHLEVLRLAPLGGFGVVERIQHAGALVGRLLNAVHDGWRRNPRGLEHRRRDVDHVTEL